MNDGWGQDAEASNGLEFVLYDKSLGEFQNPFHDQRMTILLRIYHLTQDPYGSFLSICSFFSV